MYAIDTEWDPDGNFLCGTIAGEKTYYIERGKPYTGPTYIDDIAFYFVAPRDIKFIEQFCKFREYLDLAVLIKIHKNWSSHDKSMRGQGLKDLVHEHLGIVMKHKAVDFTAKYVTPKLRLHNREDAKCTYKLARYFMAVVDKDDLAMARKMEERNKSWRAISEQTTYYDLEWQNSMIHPEVLVPRLLANGIDFFIIGEKDGKLHIKRKAMQDWLERHSVPVPMEVSNAPYASDGLLRTMHWRVFEELGRRAQDPELREKCNLVHLALRSHTAQTGEARFNSTRLHPQEVVCGQASGRVSHLACPITAGVLFRMAVIPPPGYKTLSLDIKSQEVILAAQFSQDLNLQKACEEDVYSYLASVFNGTPYVKLDKKDSYRQFVKNIVLPWLYGVAAGKLAGAMNCELQAAKILLDRLDRAFPDFWHWKGEILRAGVTRGRIHTLLDNYPLKVPAEGYNPRQVINHVIQGTGCDMLRIWVDTLVEAGYPPFATLHDGVYIYVPKDFESSKLIKISEEAFNKAIPLSGIPSFNSWVVECSEYYGHLMEKGDDYFKLVSNLTGKTVEELKACEPTC
jgi:hypothetical protein